MKQMLPDGKSEKRGKEENGGNVRKTSPSNIREESTKKGVTGRGNPVIVYVVNKSAS